MASTTRIARRTRRSGSTSSVDPYTRTGADLDGRVSIDWGVYGVPEAFVIDRQGRIAYKHIGPITPQLVDEKLRPLIANLRR